MKLQEQLLGGTSPPEAIGELRLSYLAWSPGTYTMVWLPEGLHSTVPLPSLAGTMEHSRHTNTQRHTDTDTHIHIVYLCYKYTYMLENKIVSYKV